MKHIKLYLTLILLLSSSFAVTTQIGSLFPSPDYNNNGLLPAMALDSLTSENPIIIDGDANFTTTASNRGWPGNGSSSSPFIIDHIQIEGNGSNTLISISNTNLHYIISNSHLDNSDTAIELVAAPNGRIINNTITNNDWGIAASGAMNLEVTGNNITDIDGYGIYFDHVDESKVSGNTINGSFSYGMFIYRSNDNNITQNQVSHTQYGIVVSTSSRNDILDNTVSDNEEGIVVSTPYQTRVINNTAYRNTLGIYGTGSRDNLFSHNTVFNNTEGLLVDRQSLSGSQFSNVTYNIAYGNTEAGIRVSFGEGVLVHNNMAYNNGRGLELDFGFAHQVYNNSIFNNTHGIYLNSIDSHNITDHNLINNGFFIEYYVNNLIYHKLHSLEGNTVNGLPVMYMNHTTGGTISGTYGQILLINASFISLENLHISNSSVAIFLSDSRNNTLSNVTLINNAVGIGLYVSSNDNLIKNNTIADGSISGIEMMESTGNVINGTLITNNQQGIYAEGADYTNITHNVIQYNHRDGVRIQSSMNVTITHNIIFYNGYGDPELGSGTLGIGLDTVVSPDRVNSGISSSIVNNMIIAFNLFLSNHGYGLIFSGTGSVYSNDFIENNKDDELTSTNKTKSLCGSACSQAFAFDPFVFDLNHYGHLPEDFSDDNDNDGTHDTSYPLPCGFGGDSSPIFCNVTASVESVSGYHALTPPHITKIFINVLVGKEEITVSWAKSVDTAKHDITYRVKIISQHVKGNNYISGFFSGTSLKINSFSYPRGRYKVVVEATDGVLISRSPAIEIRLDAKLSSPPKTSVIEPTTVTSTTTDTETSDTPASVLSTERGTPVNFFALIAGLLVITPIFHRVLTISTSRRRIEK